MTASSDQPVLWSFRRCPYAMRARLALKSSGVALRLREIVLRNKPDEFLTASPKGTVPVLVKPDGQVIDESLNVMFWALEQADPEDWLAIWRKDKAYCQAFLEELDGPFKTHLDRYKYSSRYVKEGDADDVQHAATRHHRKEGAAFIASLDEVLHRQPQLSGNSPRLLDS
ncbi:MAG: glutathione S-transferase N-terminal domain-containing protein, partial [Alphaproteobacteria bacterium]|nr:glutathione S-transferase N-terminal domain-containing protein [Alphaproteobacteria bacterium]